MVSSSSSTAIQATWNAPDLINQNGVLTSYQVKYYGSVLDTAERTSDININTLSKTLTGLLPYVYYCVMIRVANGAGFSQFSSANCARTHEAIPSTPPVNLIVYSLNSTAIQATWNAPELRDQNGVLTSYQVKYHGSVLDTAERTLNININTLSVILTGLLPNVYYCVMIRVENGAGFSEFSPPNCARTQEAVPSTPPVNLTVYSLNSTAIQAEWNAPELIDQNGVLTSYQVRYNGSELDTAERSLNLSINTMSVILTGLLPNVYYCVMIRVENGAGLSEFSSPNCARTQEAIPSTPPVNITVFPLNSTAIQAEWNAPELINQNGVLTRYQVKYHGSVLDTAERSLDININKLSESLIGLRPNVYYCVMIRVENGAGFSEFSSPNCTRTQEAIPSTPPINIMVSSSSSTAMQATWNAPDLINQNGVLTRYQVKYYGSVLDTAERTMDININTLSKTLTGLLPYVYYCVMIRVANGAGFSLLSSPNCTRTHEAIPSTPPVNFTVYSLNSTAIQANWNAPELRNQNGVLKSYQVRYNGSDFDTTERVLNLGIGRISVNLTGLLPDINYCVLIRVKNGAGFSKFSFSSCTRTYEANPGKATNCSVIQFQLSPSTCKLNITFSLETPQAGTGMCEYNLLFNGTVIHTIDSTPTRTNFSYFSSLSPKENFTFSLSPSEGCLNQSLYVCYQDTLPSYDFVNGSFNVTFSPESNIFNSSWTYRVIPPFASEHLVQLKIFSTQIFHYQFFHQDIWYTRERNIEYYLFSNQTMFVDTFPYGQVGMILERFILTKENQIIIQCGYNFTGEISNAAFNYTDLTCRDEYCYLDTDMDTYPDLLTFCPQFNMSCKDNCPNESNPDQNDCDNNGIGDVCDNTCEPETDSLFNLYWKCTKGGEMVLVNCPNGTNTARRMCEQSGDWNTSIDTSQCVSNEYGSISNVTSVEGLDIVIQVLNETMPKFSGDIIIIVDILDSTVDATAQSNQSEVIVTKTIQVIDVLTNSSQLQLLNQTQQSSGVVQKILGLLDAQAQVLAVNRSMDVRLNESQNVFFETKTIKQDQVGDVVLTADNIQSDGQPPPSVTIPVQNIAGENGKMSVSVVVLRNIANLITSFADKITLGTRGLKLSSFSNFEIVTPVVSVQIFNDEKLITTNSNNTLVTLNLPLELSRIIYSDNFYRPTCLFLANATSNNPKWRDEGIRNVSSTEVTADNVLTCNSGHSTAFVVLIGINNLEDQTFVLNILSYLGCSVSIVCLLLSIAIYLLFGFKLLRKIYHFAHFQLSFSLLLLYIAFLFGVELAYVDVWFYIPCKMVTVLIEYLLLVVFLWMLLEGVVILIMVIWPFHIFNWKHFLTFFCVAWLIPLLYVIPFIPFFHNFYLSPPISSNVSFGANYCWLHSDVNTHIIYSVTVPIALIILINLIIITIVIVRYILLVAKQRSLSKFHRVQKTALRLLRLILVLFPVLGFGWAFGLLAVYFNRVVFAWMFTILCSFQGLSILIFVLLLRRDIQKSIVKKLNLKSHFSTLQFRLSELSKQIRTKDNVNSQQADIDIPNSELDLDSPPSVIMNVNWRDEIEELELTNQLLKMDLMFYEGILQNELVQDVQEWNVNPSYHF